LSTGRSTVITESDPRPPVSMLVAKRLTNTPSGTPSAVYASEPTKLELSPSVT
jgi:hypothetical protein